MTKQQQIENLEFERKQAQAVKRAAYYGTPHSDAVLAALVNLAIVARQNIGRRVKQGANPAPATVKLNRIRDALAIYDKVCAARRNHLLTPPHS